MFAKLIIGRRASEKLVARDIDGAEIREVAGNGPVSVPNPQPRVPGSRLLIGETNTGRILTIVVNPDFDDENFWHVMTAWESSRAQIDLYFTRRRA